jgi:arylsulfatase A-like enzyme
MPLLYKLAALLCLSAISSFSAQPPNIILFLADDLGYGEVNQNSPWAFPPDPYAAGGGKPLPRPTDPERTISTPNLQRLAQQGLRAFSSYSPSSECAPSRAAIILGRNTGTTEIRGNSVMANGLNPDLSELGFVVKLQAAGYDTALVGKWGLGSTTAAPWKRGFDFFLGQLEHKEAWDYYVRSGTAGGRARDSREVFRSPISSTRTSAACKRTLTLRARCGSSCRATGRGRFPSRRAPCSRARSASTPTTCSALPRWTS